MLLVPLIFSLTRNQALTACETLPWLLLGVVGSSLVPSRGSMLTSISLTRVAPSQGLSLFVSDYTSLLVVGV